MITVSNKSGTWHHSHFTFSGGETQIKIPEEVVETEVTINFSPLNAEEVFELALLVDALRRGGAVVAALNMPYVPYARQDRVMQSGESLSIKVFCDFINSLGFPAVYIRDPHSDVTPALLNNVEVQNQTACILQNKPLCKKLMESKYDAIVAPDAGAMKKAYALAEIFKLPVIYGTKHRDIVTGEITHTSISGCVEDLSLLIADDICDGMRTFIELAKQCKQGGASSVDLYVTHGIFSRGIEVGRPHIDDIYSTDSWGNIEHEGVIY